MCEIWTMCALCSCVCYGDSVLTCMCLCGSFLCVHSCYACMYLVCVCVYVLAMCLCVFIRVWMSDVVFVCMCLGWYVGVCVYGVRCVYVSVFVGVMCYASIF